MKASQAMTWLMAFAIACRPDFGDRESLVTRARVLAMRGEPAEAKPGDPVEYSILVATPSGPVAAPLASWAFCSSPKLLTENGAASAACLDTDFVPVADAASAIEAPVPADACRVFGPDVTSADLRPRDPDITGGFYQPLRVTLRDPRTDDGGPAVAFGFSRITCNLANAAGDVARDFGQRYVANRNPELVTLSASVGGQSLALDAIPRGAGVTLRTGWADASAERYVVYDLSSRRLVERRESLRVSWFATAGSFAQDRTGRAEEEAETFTENAWTAPDAAASVHLFVVLRDARGGVAFSSHVLGVR